MLKFYNSQIQTFESVFKKLRKTKGVGMFEVNNVQKQTLKEHYIIIKQYQKKQEFIEVLSSLVKNICFVFYFPKLFV